MNKGLQLLADLTVFSKYGKYVQEIQRRETWDEIIDRYEVMMMNKYPTLKKEIVENGQFIRDRKVLPSMRALQFAGAALEVNNARGYNCAYLPIDNIQSFAEVMFLLLGGTGVGYSVQTQHVAELPIISKPTKSRRFLVADDIMGWADAVKVLMKAYMGGGTMPEFDFRGIRAKGVRLITAGGKAPGPEPLKLCLIHIQAILDRKNDGEKLSPLEVHDICCHIANSVLSGGIRRSAMISLFSLDDQEMLTCKYGNWWELNEQRGRANNSAVLKRGEVSEEQFQELWKKIEASGSGEPGIYWTDNLDWGTNPCCFTGDTKVLTSAGYRPISSLIGETELVNKDGEFCNALVWSNGIKPVIELTLSTREKIKCTGDHTLMLATGEEVFADQSYRLRLMPYYKMNESVSEYTKYGFIQGDGSCSRLSSAVHKGLEISIGRDDDDIFELFGIQKEEGKVSYYTNGYNEILKALKFDETTLITRSLPLDFIFWKIEDRLMFLKGMYSANGSVIKKGRISYKTVSKKLAQKIVEQLEYVGISAYITTNKEKEVQFKNGNYTCKESYDINIANLKSIIVFAEKIGFVHQYKKDALHQIILDKAPLVMTIKEVGEQEVFDFSLDDDTHWGVIEGIVAHNCEIALRPYQMCNLAEINVDNIESQQDLNERAIAAAFFGTLQAGFTDFHYLRPIWKKTCEKDALLGIGQTGICSGEVLKYNLEEAASAAVAQNAFIAKEIGIKQSARVTCIKPSGTTSCVLGCSSGIHAWHDAYYLRTMRFNKNEEIAEYMMEHHPELCEDDVLRSHDTVCIRIPIKAPEKAIMRTETAIDTLERLKRFSQEWIRPGHNNGDNTHNVSATISIDKNRKYQSTFDKQAILRGFKIIDEWKIVGDWMWENKDAYNGISVLPFSDHTYQQAPFETITKETYEQKMLNFPFVDFTQVIEKDDNVQYGQVAACAGGACSVE